MGSRSNVRHVHNVIDGFSDPVDGKSFEVPV